MLCMPLILVLTLTPVQEATKTATQARINLQLAISAKDNYVTGQQKSDLFFIANFGF